MEIFPRISEAKTAKESWDTLQEEFRGSEKVRTIKLQSLRRALGNIQMKESETAREYYSRIKELVNKLRSYGENISDEKIVQKILISLMKRSLSKLLLSLRRVRI